MALFEIVRRQPDGTVVTNIVEADTLGDAINAYNTWSDANGVSGEILSQNQLPNDAINAGSQVIKSDGTLGSFGEDPGGGGVPVNPPPATIQPTEPPPVAEPIAPDVPVGTGEAGDFGSQFDRDLALPAAAFRNFLRSGGVAPGGTGGALLQNQAGQSNNVFNALSGLGFLPEGTSFTDFLGSGEIGSARLQRLAGEALATNPSLSGDIFKPGGTEFTDAAANIASLSRTAGGQNFGFGFTPTVSQVQQRLQDQANLGGTINPDEFLEFLRQQFGRQNRPGSNAAISSDIGRIGAVR